MQNNFTTFRPEIKDVKKLYNIYGDGKRNKKIA